MKKILGLVTSLVLYYIGDMISKPMLRFDWSWIYPVYNRLMVYSYNIQKWAYSSSPRNSKSE